ncbi:MAG: alpha/beta hydrolase [Cytophagaceae bacterium]|nr:alpha/beta hydrolase [Cytophagaceae bacterium]
MTCNYKGVPIFYTDQGKGAPVVLLHGFLEEHSMWSSLMNDLVSRHRVIRIDLLGHGQSGHLGYIHSMEDMAEAVKCVIDILQLNNITLIGHSMGGYVSCAFAKAYPEILAGICLLNATPLPDTPERKQLRKRANHMAQSQYEALVRMSFVNLFDPMARQAHQPAIDMALSKALQTPVQGYIAANKGMAIRDNYTTVWKNLSIKKAMILGRTDWIVDAQLHKDKFESYCDLFDIIEGGHMSHISNQKCVLKAIQQFLFLEK